jgi:GT2 family glycosyltransferase
MRDHVRIIVPTRNPIRVHTLVHTLRADGWSECVVVHPSGAGAVSSIPAIETDQLLSPAAARNCGAAGAQTAFLCFLDDDVECSSATLDALLERCTSPGIIATGPVLADNPTDSYWRRCMHRVMSGPQFVTARTSNVASLMSMCLVVRRDAFEAVGGFDEIYTHPAGEDTALTMRLASLGALAIVQTARITHRPQPDGWSTASRRLFRYGTAWAQVGHATGHGRRWVRQLPTVLRWCMIGIMPLVAFGDALIATSYQYWLGYTWLRLCWYTGLLTAAAGDRAVTS